MQEEQGRESGTRRFRRGAVRGLVLGLVMAAPLGGLLWALSGRAEGFVVLTGSALVGGPLAGVVWTAAEWGIDRLRRGNSRGQAASPLPISEFRARYR